MDESVTGIIHGNWRPDVREQTVDEIVGLELGCGVVGVTGLPLLDLGRHRYRRPARDHGGGDEKAPGGNRDTERGPDVPLSLPAGAFGASFRRAPVLSRATRAEPGAARRGNPRTTCARPWELSQSRRSPRAFTAGPGSGHPPAPDCARGPSSPRQVIHAEEFSRRGDVRERGREEKERLGGDRWREGGVAPPPSTSACLRSDLPGRRQ